MPSVPSRLALAAYLLVAGANVVSLGAGAGGPATATQALLMPLLVVGFLTLRPRGREPLSRLRTAVLVALGAVRDWSSVPLSMTIMATYAVA